MKRALNFEKANLQYEGIIGTGGIGTGNFFQLNGNHTLGREESRSGFFLDVKDYCKQHIILHYVKVLLGDVFPVIPVGRVGDDTYGNAMINEMREAGFMMDYVEKIKNISTLFSFCFYYPDGNGGNLTTDNSASSLVDNAAIDTVTDEIKKLKTKGMIMAAPEVPFETRKYLIELGKKNGLFCTASFTTEEIPVAIQSGILSKIDLLAINVDEAAAVTGMSWEEHDVVPLIHQAVQKILTYNEDMLVSITAGKRGSWCWTGQGLIHFPAIETTVKSTAGAGDSFFAGLLCGKALGLSIAESQQLATLIAGLKVQSPHTINKEVDRKSLESFMKNSGLQFSGTIINLLKN